MLMRKQRMLLRQLPLRPLHPATRQQLRSRVRRQLDPDLWREPQTHRLPSEERE